MISALIIFPHQLFADHPGVLKDPDRVILFEDPLFFGDPQYPARFHRQKLWLHRATMAAYRERLEHEGQRVETVPYAFDTHLIDKTVGDLADAGVAKIFVSDPVDDIVMRRLRRAVKAADVRLSVLPTPGFLNSRDDNDRWSAGRSRWLMADFYKWQRKRFDILVRDGAPVGGQWSFDEANRKKVPSSALNSIPELPILTETDQGKAARDSVLRDFPDAPGSLETLYYPTTHAEAERWLDDFLVRRFASFGDYEDAIVAGESWLWHAVLTPALNVGLLTPDQVVSTALDCAEAAQVPLNSVEGFIRQVIGWREFMRASYETHGVEMRAGNHWAQSRSLPSSFYDATTGIDPVHDVIRRVLDTGYCHHIERLMVLGGFMFLCEIKPDDVYRWFMEMFIDSYDWVMVPNVYGMSQNADGGRITTKPYFSGSNYIRKMSHWKPGPWSDVWDGLYWRFIWKHRAELAGNRRWAMMVRSVEKMDECTRARHLNAAEAYLAKMN